MKKNLNIVLGIALCLLVFFVANAISNSTSSTPLVENLNASVSDNLEKAIPCPPNCGGSTTYKPGGVGSTGWK